MLILHKNNKKNSFSIPQGTQRHPDNDPSITYCSRCGCPPDSHEIVVWENEKELAADAYSLHQWDSAVIHYTRAIDLHPVDATLWTNRSATYLAKGWYEQALHDAAHAVSLRPEWFRPWSRKGAALLGLGKLKEAVEAYKKALQCAQSDSSASESTITGMKSALKDAEKKMDLAQRKKNPVAATAQKPTGAQAPVAVVAPPAIASTSRILDRRATVNPRTPAHTEEIKNEVSYSSFSLGRASNQSFSEEEEMPSSFNPSAPPQQELFTAVQNQYSAVVKEVEKLKALMDQLQHQLKISSEDYINDDDDEVKQQQQHQQNEEMTSLDSKSSGSSSSSSSEDTEDGAVEDIDDQDSSSSTYNSKEENEVEQNPRELRTEAPAKEEIQTTEEQSPNSSDVDDEFDAEFEWLDSVQAARKKLLGAEEATNLGFIPPPPTSASALAAPSRRKPKNISEYAAEGASTDRKTSTPDKSSTIEAAIPTSKLDLGSLQSLFITAAAKQRRKDPLGVERYACKRCGAVKCSQYENKSLHLFTSHAVQMQRDSVEDLQQKQQQLPPQSILQARQCSSCGCDCSAHETEEEAKDRESKEQRAKERQEKIKLQREERLRQQQQQVQRQPPPSPETERIKRVLAAAARKAAAEEAGEPLQCTDCDVLTQSKRGTCTACKACSGFKIYYSSTDANNPEIMLYCATCGCTAESHPVDSSWEQKESARREAENAAAARAAARARQSFNAQAAVSAAARKEEADAYAVLGLHYGADSKAVTRAYKRLALKLHPDKVSIARRNSGEDGDSGKGNDEEAEAAAHAAFVKITQAYKFLSEMKL
jgi:tetratricopeptide (TPR) repeat protein